MLDMILLKSPIAIFVFIIGIGISVVLGYSIVNFYSGISNNVITKLDDTFNTKNFSKYSAVYFLGVAFITWLCVITLTIRFVFYLLMVG